MLSESHLIKPNVADGKQQSFSDEEGGIGAEIRLVTAGFKVGKVPETCEDAFFITERGFGVADGVSGWNDYGFSSSAFAN
jgi:formylmethanofuran:tetrahydromethanopterin formyltransferase